MGARRKRKLTRKEWRESKLGAPDVVIGPKPPDQPGEDAPWNRFAGASTATSTAPAREATAD
jgi:hypothetical protein